MAVDVLQNKLDNTRARIELRQRGVDFTSNWIYFYLRKFKLLRGINIGDRRKNWDVLKTLQFLDEKVAKDARVLDLGAYASEVLCALHKIGYLHLYGIDLNPKIIDMPFARTITYTVGNFLKTPFEEASFSAVTAISVIEHGFEGKKFLKELSRILKPGGYFIASVDYWPDKIDTTGIKAFGLDWMIYSKNDLNSFIREAENFELKPYGKLNFDSADRTVNWHGKAYTFAWLVLKKNE